MIQNIFNRFNLVFIILFVATQVAVSKVPAEKSKVINKSYKINSGTEVSVDNFYGLVHVNNSKTNEVSISVEIITRGKTDQQAQRLLDQIDIEIRNTSGSLSFEPELDNIGMIKNMDKDDQLFEINFTLNMPSTNSLSVSNRFGDVFISNRSGENRIEVRYGNLKMEDQSGDSRIEIAFGNGTIGNLNNAKIEMQYGELRVGSTKDLDLEQGFSDVEIMDVAELEIESKYGKVKLGKVGNFDGDAQFSGLTIEELSGSLYLEASYISDFEVQNITKEFTGIEIHGKFSSYELNFADDVKADVEAEFSYSDLKSSSNTELYYQVKENNRSEYKGRIGGGNPNKLVIVKSSYGDLRIR